MTERALPQVRRASLLAHSPPGDRSTRDGDAGHPLFEHLTSTARRAEAFAEAFGAGEVARIAGLCHDLGKAQAAFQRYIRGEPVRAPHALHGALLLLERFAQSETGLALALIIAGHHTGLPSHGAKEPGDRPSRTFLQRQAEAVDLAEIEAALPGDYLPSSLPRLPSWLDELARRDPPAAARSFEMWTRFLFSALVDADFLDTAAFYQGGERPRPFASIGELRRRLDTGIDELVSGLGEAERGSEVNRLRAEVLAACRGGAELSPGFFSLTVPTGGGKTLAAMSFALRHAERHGLRRVIAAIPYTSILEQNAKVYREHLGDAEVVEHHSAFDVSALDTFDVDGEASEIRRAHEYSTENWDAPVVVTTNVQLFESLFGNRTSSCRKLHNLARSVILLDEAQVLPGGLLEPILDALRELVAHYGCSIVLTTATRPAFDARDGFPRGLENIRELAPDADGLARRLRRVEVEWRRDEVTEWPQLAEELAQLETALAIVHKRDDARELAMLLDEACGDGGVVHLSAAMCPAHRAEVLARVRQRLDGGEPCRLVATQLIEAGVDVDFPVVFRALGGLDSLVQAAGRCNREGGLERGRFVVFRAPSKPPPGAPQRGLEQIQAMLEVGEVDLYSLADIELYFRKLQQVNESDKCGIQPLRAELAFATVARKFRLIDDTWSVGVVVPWGDGASLIDELERRAEYGKPARALFRRLQRYTVNLPRWLVEETLLPEGHLHVVADSVLALGEPSAELYDEAFGFDLSRVAGSLSAEALIV